MSESYYEHTQNDSDDDVESPDIQPAAIDTPDFVLEGILEEMGAFMNFDVNKTFTRQEWQGLSQPLQGFIISQRLSSRHQSNKNPGPELSNSDMDAKPSSDVNVTVRSRTSNKVEQITVETSDEETGPSMQRIASNLMQASDSDRSCNEKEATAT